MYCDQQNVTDFFFLKKGINEVQFGQISFVETYCFARCNSDRYFTIQDWITFFDGLLKR